MFARARCLQIFTLIWRQMSSVNNNQSSNFVAALDILELHFFCNELIRQFKNYKHLEEYLIFYV